VSETLLGDIQQKMVIHYVYIVHRFSMWATSCSSSPQLV